MSTQSKDYWEDQKANATKAMEKIWPKVKELRAKLNTLQNSHDEHQALLYEAERHLVEVIRLKVSDSGKKDTNHWLKKIDQMSFGERNELVKRLKEKRETTFLL